MKMYQAEIEKVKICLKFEHGFKKKMITIQTDVCGAGQNWSG